MALRHRRCPPKVTTPLPDNPIKPFLTDYWVYRDTHDQPGRVDQDVPLPSVIASWTSSFGHPCGLAVDNRCAGRAIMPSIGAHMRPKCCMNTLPEAPESPSPVRVVRRWPWRQVVWHESPGISTSNHVENAVQDVTERPFSRSASRVRHWKQWVEDGPLGIRGIRRIRCSGHSSKYSSDPSKLIDRVFKRILDITSTQGTSVRVPEGALGDAQGKPLAVRLTASHGCSTCRAYLV